MMLGSSKSQNSGSIKPVFFGFIIFFFLWKIDLVVLPFATSKLFILLAIVYFMMNIKLVIRMLIRYKNIFIPLLFSILFAVCITIFQNAYDYSVAYNFLLHLMYLFTSYFLVLRFYNRGVNTIESMICIVETAILLNAIIVVFMFISPEIKEFIYSLIKAEQADFSSKNPVRQIGIGGFSTYADSFVYSLGILLILFRKSLNYSMEKISFFDYIKIFFFSISVILAGRTGFIGLFFSIIILFFYMPKTFFKLILIFSVTLFGAMFLLQNSAANDLIINRLIPWAFQFFIRTDSMMEQGTLASVIEQLQYPMSAKTFLFGDGYYVVNYGNGYYSNDLGYIRLITYFGVIGSILYYSVWLIMFGSIHKKLHNTNSKIILIVIFFYLFLVQVKGNIMATPEVSILFSYLFVSFMFFNRQEKLRF